MLNEYSRELALILMKPFSHHEALLLERLSDLSEFVGICLFICSAMPAGRSSMPDPPTDFCGRK
jgi:hypothetical protein